MKKIEIIIRREKVDEVKNKLYEMGATGIMLSNIACFIQKMYDNPLEDFRNDILKIMKLLNKNGVLFLAYLYDMRDCTVVNPIWDLIYHLDKVFEVFKNENISYEKFIGIKGLIHDEEKFTDMVLTLRK